MPDLPPDAPDTTVSPSIRSDDEDGVEELPLWLRMLGSDEAWDVVDGVGRLLGESTLPSSTDLLVDGRPDLELPSTRFVRRWHESRVALARLGVRFSTEAVPKGASTASRTDDP